MHNSPTAHRTFHSALAAIALFAFGCATGSSPRDTMPNEFAGAPDWVIHGCRSYAGEPTPAKLCGVGAFKGSNNILLTRTAAMARGRTEIARRLGIAVRSSLKDYQATTTDGADFGGAVSHEQHVADVSKQITDISLTGAEIQGTWLSNSGTYYALMVLDVEKLEESMSGMRRLSDEIRKAIIERAKAAFADLDDQ
ncbi:MAG: hypothetical protein ACI8W3_003095 [Myxococcota bacterium]|jgi:hypothetical protein